MRILLSLLLALALVRPAAAQTEPSPRQIAAARAMLESMDMEQALTVSIETMLTAQVEANPQLRPVEGVMRTFLTRYLTWDALADGYARIYASHFTEQELAEMSTFYRTPTGQKLARALPRLMQEGSELGQRTVQQHMGELQTMIMDEMQRQGGGTTP